MSMEDGSNPKTEPAEAKIPKQVIVDGVRFPKVFETNRPMEEHIDCLKALEMREDDVIICAFKKSGSHWLWEIVAMLISGKAEYEKRTMEFFMMEAVEIESIQSLPSPRILNAHVPTQMLPAQVKDKKTKIIHVYRNPKDVAVSYYCFLKQSPKFSGVTLENTLQMHINTEDKSGYVFHLQSMAKFMEDNPDHPVFSVSFEEVKEDHVGTVRRLGEFLGVKTTPELCADIARATGFDNMKQADSSKMHKTFVKEAGVNHYRKGVVGDWKNHLTVAQSEAVDARMKKLEGCDKFHFRYTL